jgi:hypothetical protein
MDDAFLVGVLHCRADMAKQLQPLALDTWARLSCPVLRALTQPKASPLGPTSAALHALV